MKCFGCLGCSINKQCLLILQSLAIIVVDRAFGHWGVTKSGIVQVGFSQVGALQIQILHNPAALSFFNASSPLKVNAAVFSVVSLLAALFSAKNWYVLGPLTKALCLAQNTDCHPSSCLRTSHTTQFLIGFNGLLLKSCNLVVVLLHLQLPLLPLSLNSSLLQTSLIFSFCTFLEVTLFNGGHCWKCGL